MAAVIDFDSLIQEDRELRQGGCFSGSFLDYLTIIKENPQNLMLAHQRMYELLMQQGLEVIKTDENPRLRRLYGSNTIKRYNVFKDKFFGMDKALQKIMRYFHAAAMKGEESRQVLYLVGPVGAGKSSIMEALKRVLEMSSPIYVIKDCPIREEPLHLIPKHLRPKFQEILGVNIEGDLCPICRYKLRTLYKGQFEKYPITTSNFAIHSREGFGIVSPVDPNNQDTSVLTGSVDISKLDLYPEDDPRVLSLNGAFNTGNRGIVEFIEVFKNDVEYLHTMITATQEKCIPSPGKGPMIYFDGVILAHSNEAEWNKFKSDHTNEAILDRIVKVEVPYCTELDEEVKIYQKMLAQSTFNAHIAPHTLEIASMFAILSRLKPSNQVDALTKLKIYNGEDILEKGTTKKVDIEQLQEEAPREAMTGISTRFIMKALDNALSEAENHCINPVGVLDTLVKSVKELSISDDEKKQYLSYLQDTLKKEYHKMLEKEITRAFLHGYREQAESLFDNYLDHAEAFVNAKKIKDRNTGEELEPDVKFLESIEEQIGICGTAVLGFRQDVTAYMFSVLRSGGTLNYESYEPLKEAIENKLTASVKELSRIITKAKVRNKEQHTKYDEMVNEMMKNGYCYHCCNVVLKYAANNLWKD